ncbi:hypothetical protein B0T21DRAFT_414993 [Apiosordaria backusii]|uniref:Uncharacterized protein n=1 Tax=Apiosordaria backusii TaxID=314023 RepID=A0AA40AN91_9PEZI|nr:hypothetical protein B0T21DRAFT_414993 [Apiosordaria backusii]
MKISTAIACMGLVQLSWAAKKCYYQDGREATSDAPCDPDAENSMCCFRGSPHGRACLANKMCQSPDGKTIRGSCTDRDWKSPECADLCRSVDYGGANLISCSNVTDRDTSFCCEKTEKANCCDSGIGRFELQPPQPITLAFWDSSEGTYSVVARISTSTSSSTSSTTSASTTPSESTRTSTTTSTGGAKETGSGSSNTNEGSSDTREGSTGGSDQASASPSGGLPPAAQAGIGVGVAAIVVLLAVIAWLVWKLNKNRQALVEPAPFLDPTQQQPSPYVQEWYKQQQEQNVAELRSGRGWDQQQYSHGTPASAELQHYGPQISAELPAEVHRYA